MVLAGLNYLHMFIDTQYKVIHRDVKSSKSQFQVRDRCLVGWWWVFGGPSFNQL
ncbi:putative protein kinase [Helianthus annuus]|uniref:Protein kinase domain-containing protein n=1 Tax=Helianthus annuus TaxID=4232 RepID=A0A9K3I3T0_HELAN|nr:putative protein kinase [Helianthus annuus]